MELYKMQKKLRQFKDMFLQTVKCQTDMKNMLMVPNQQPQL